MFYIKHHYGNITNASLLYCVLVGLDVKGCDVVIRFGGAPSLIQVVQSKGRARDKNGRMLLVCTREEEGHFDELMAQEELLDRVLTKNSSSSLV